jgi:hypothetical protein
VGHAEQQLHVIPVRTLVVHVDIIAHQELIVVVYVGVAVLA